MDLQPIDLEIILTQVLRHLKLAIDQSHALVIQRSLTYCNWNKTQLVKALAKSDC
jgi:hypothetical protein